MLDRFYPIFPGTDWLHRLLPCGIRLVQLRLKNLPDAQLRSEILHATEICRLWNARLVINDHWQAAIDLGCSFVHLGQEDLVDADVAAIRKAGIGLGISTHDEAELEVALSHKPDYVALGPIHPTRLKKMKWHRQGVERLTEWRRRIGDMPLVAIGGMTVERAPAALEAGADIVSVVTDIIWNPDPESRVAQWIAATH